MHVLMLNAYAVEQAARLRALLSERWSVECHVETDPAAALAGKIARADVLVSPRFPPGLPPAPRLRLVQSPVAGFDKIDFASLPAGCVVANVHEHEIGVSEYALLAMLEWSIRIGPIDARFRAGSWADGVSALGPTHGEIHGKTLGIVGAGHIGRAVAARARAFGMRTVAVTRTPRAGKPFDEVLPMDALDATLGRSDFVVLACPLNDETRGLLDARRLGLCAPHAVIVNLARGPVVDEEAFYRALADGVIGGAVIDVWYDYPGPGSPAPRPSRFPFHELDNVIMTPHCSSWSEGLLPRRWKIIAHNIEALADGRPLMNQVWPEQGRP